MQLVNYLPQSRFVDVLNWMCRRLRRDREEEKLKAEV